MKPICRCDKCVGDTNRSFPVQNGTLQQVLFTTYSGQFNGHTSDFSQKGTMDQSSYPKADKQEQPTGIKHDQDKPDMSLLSSIAMTEMAKVMTFGKKKYSAHNWRGGFIWSRPAAAALRHIFSWLGGEDKDPETGLSHLSHALCCLMFLVEFEVTKPELDDRFKKAQK